ncbi:unnamed protein product, partial [Rotaria magnacalcarata]
MEYGISKSALENLRHELNNNNIIDSQSLIQVIDLPNIEEFWSMLKDREVLTNEIEFIIVNKQKLELVDMKEITNLVETYEMKFEFEKLQTNELIQYPIGTCEEYIFCKIELYENLKKSDRIYLEDRCILSTNRRAKINPNEIKEEQIFDKFNSITLSDLTSANISAENSIGILKILSPTDDGILEEIAHGKYKLKGHINCSTLPECYQDHINYLQEQYNDIQENAKLDISSKLQLRLSAKPYEQLFYDLIDCGIIEDVKINYGKLKSIELKNIFEQPIQSYAKNHRNLSKNENIEFIKKTLEQLHCGIEKFETADCFFSSLEEEQRYSWKFWRNFAIVVVLGVSQIVAGAVLEIFTAGVGTYAASFLINEGISDLFFATGCLFSGYMTMSSYWEHKKWSMAMSVATCMIGGILARSKTVSWIGYKVAGSVRTEGGKKIAQMVGKELIQNVGAKTVVKETMKRVGCKLLEGVAFGAAQGAINH